MRNPKNSHEKSDSNYGVIGYGLLIKNKPEWFDCGIIRVDEHPYIGPKDLKLACALIHSGSEHRKFLRMIEIWVDFTLPRYVWVDLDTYKISTTRNSESSRFKPRRNGRLSYCDFIDGNIDIHTLGKLNDLIYKWQKKRDRDAMIEFKKCLPEGYLQKSTYHFNYETALNILCQRKNHPLREFKILCDWILTLPYMKEFYEARTCK